MLHLHKDLEIHRDHTGKSQTVTVSCKCYSDYVTKTVSFPESGDPDIPEPTVDIEITDFDSMTLRGQIDVEWFVPEELAQTGTSRNDVAKARASWTESFNSYQPIINAEKQLLTDCAEFD